MRSKERNRRVSPIISESKRSVVRVELEYRKKFDGGEPRVRQRSLMACRKSFAVDVGLDLFCERTGRGQRRFGSAEDHREDGSRRLGREAEGAQAHCEPLHVPAEPLAH